MHDTGMSPKTWPPVLATTPQPFACAFNTTPMISARQWMAITLNPRSTAVWAVVQTTTTCATESSRRAIENTYQLNSRVTDRTMLSCCAFPAMK